MEKKIIVILHLALLLQLLHCIMAPKKSKVTTKPKEALYKFPESYYNLPKLLAKLFFKPGPESIISDQIITINNFFTSEFCNELIKSFVGSLTLETTPLIKSKDYAARFNDRISLNDIEASKVLWTYLKDILLQDPGYQDEELDEIKSIFQDAHGLNPQLRIYRYRKGHHFGKHYDDSVVCEGFNKDTPKVTTKWTLLIYLTGDDEFKGGDTIFYPEFERNAKPVSIHPTKGMALLHKHGDDCLKHEAQLVSEGEKWVLRSDVSYAF